MSSSGHSLLWQFLRAFLFFDALKFFRLLARSFVDIPLYVNMTLISWWDEVIGRKNIEVKCHFHHIIARVPTINMTSSWPWFHALSCVCQISPLYNYSLSSPFPFSICFTIVKENHYTQPTPDECHVAIVFPWGQVIYVSYLEFCRDLSLHPIYLFIYFYEYVLMDIPGV